MSISSIPGLSPLLNSLAGNSSSSSSGSTQSSSSSTGTSSTSTSTVGSNLPAIAQFDQEQYQQAQTQLTGYTQLQSVLQSFQGSMVSVLAEPFSTALSGVTSSNSGVAYISPSAANNYAVDVSQLAQAQQIETNYGTGSTFSTAGGTLQIQLGNIDTTGGTFSANGQAVSISIANGDSLQQIADAISNANAGVTASVVTDGSGTSQLQIQGGDSGAANGFEVTATTTDASGTGLNTLVYSDTNTANYATQQAAQDAKYTVNGQDYSSPTNNNVPVAAGINLNLLTTGSTVVSQPQTPANVVNAANSLVSTINGLFSVLQQFSGSGGPLANDPSVVNELQNDITFALNSAYGSGSVAQLSQVGIQLQPDGTYSVNTTQLSQAYQTDPSSTQNLISQVAGALLQVAQNYNGQYGAVTNQITNLTGQEQLFAQQFQIDSQTVNTATTQAQQAVQAYNLLALATGGSASPYTSVVG